MSHAALDALARSLAGPFAFVGLAVSQRGQDHLAIQTAPGIVATADTFFRVASVSKIATAQTLAGHDLDLPAEQWLGFPLDHPKGGAVTLAQLASHTAGLSDAALPVRPDRTLDDWMRENPVWLDHAPGTYFSYANLGYILLAACAERVCKERFDYLSARTLRDWSVPGAFNWTGMPTEDVRAALPTFRRDGARFIPQIDGGLSAPGVFGQDGNIGPMGLSIARLSPQGGLRTSLAGMLAMAKAIPTMDCAPLWRHEDGPGDYLDGLFHHYGLGLQILPDPPFYPRPLIGHFGNAYGFNGGVWFDAANDLCFAYALNGLEIGDDSDALSATERSIFDAMSRLKG